MNITPMQTTNNMQPNFKALKISKKVLGDLGCTKKDLLRDCPALHACSKYLDVKIKQSTIPANILRKTSKGELNQKIRNYTLIGSTIGGAIGVGASLISAIPLSVILPITMISSFIIGRMHALKQKRKIVESHHIRCEIDNGTEKPYIDIISLERVPELSIRALEQKMKNFLDENVSDIRKILKVQDDFQKNPENLEKAILSSKAHLEQRKKEVVKVIDNVAKIPITWRNAKAQEDLLLTRFDDSNTYADIYMQEKEFPQCEYNIVSRIPLENFKSTYDQYKIKLQEKRKIRINQNQIEPQVPFSDDIKHMMAKRIKAIQRNILLPNEQNMFYVFSDVSWIIKNCPQKALEVLNMKLYDNSTLWATLFKYRTANNDVFWTLMDTYSEYPEKLTEIMFDKKKIYINYFDEDMYKKYSMLEFAIDYCQSSEFVYLFIRMIDDPKTLKKVIDLMKANHSENPYARWNTEIEIAQDKIAKINNDKRFAQPKPIKYKINKSNTLEQTGKDDSTKLAEFVEIKEDSNAYNDIKRLSPKQMIKVLLSSNSIIKTEGKVLNEIPTIVLRIPDIIPSDTEEYKTLIETLKKYPAINYNVKDSFGISFLEKVLNSENQQILDIIKDKNLIYTPELDYAYQNIQNNEFKEKVKELSLRFQDIEKAVELSSQEAINKLDAQFKSPLFTQKTKKRILELSKNSTPEFRELLNKKLA